MGHVCTYVGAEATWDWGKGVASPARLWVHCPRGHPENKEGSGWGLPQPWSAPHHTPYSAYALTLGPGLPGTPGKPWDKTEHKVVTLLRPSILRG